MIRGGSLYTQLSTLLLLRDDRTNTLAWQKLLNLSVLSTELTVFVGCFCFFFFKVHTLTFFIATSEQLTIVVLSLLLEI